MKLKVVQPTYYNQFSCLGLECKYHCCQEWRITLKKSEYTHICSQIRSKEVESLFRHSFPRNKKSNEDQNYAQVDYDENYKCRMLNEENLCRLQLSCGHEALPVTCQVFPRSEALISGVVERQLSLGCEAVTDILMRETDGLSFEQSETPPNKRFPKSFGVTEQDVEARPALAYLWDIKTLAAGVLQERDLSLDDRMTVLGLILQEVSRLEDGEKIDSFPQFMNSLLQTDLSTLLPDNLEKTTPSPIVSISSAVFFLYSLGAAIENNRLFPLLNDIYHAAGSTGLIPQKDSPLENGTVIDLNLEIDMAAYKASKERYLLWLENRGHFLENAALALFLYCEIPFKEKSLGIWDHYLYFANLYNILKTSILGVLNGESCAGLDVCSEAMDEAVVQAVTSFARSLTHSQYSVAALVERARMTGTDTLAHMAILIKA